MKRYGWMIGVRPERIEDYVREHAEVWPDVLAQIRASNIRNYSIYLRQPENVMFACYEYHGTDHDADMAAMAADPVTQEWWALCKPMQVPLDTRKEGEWWVELDEVFHMD